MILEEFKEGRPQPVLTIPRPLTALSIPRPCLVAIVPLPAKLCPNKLALNVPNNILRNPPFCFFTWFWTVSVTPINNKPESSRDFTILRISSISSFDIISAVLSCPDPKIFLCIPASAVNPRGIKTLLANGLVTSFISGRQSGF